MTIRRLFAAAPESVGQSRRFVADALAGLPEDVRGTVVLMVSELATNALVHATSDFELAIDQTPAFIRVEVSDASGESPELRSPTSREPHGRGLRIVDELSDEWGTTDASDRPGKSIWFKVALRGAAASRGTDQRFDRPVADPPVGAHPEPSLHNEPLALRRPASRRPLRAEQWRTRSERLWSLVRDRLAVGTVIPA